MTSTLMVAFLSITLPIKDRMLVRRLYFNSVMWEIADDRGVANAHELLDKYK